MRRRNRCGRQPGKALVLQVEDSGPGIPLAERDLVFQPFYRALGTEADGSRSPIPEQAVHRFRSKPITDSGASRSPIPEQADHRFRSKPITDSVVIGQGRNRVAGR